MINISVQTSVILLLIAFIFVKGFRVNLASVRSD